jgi:thiocyanate hydrolase subunit gamma
LKPKSPNGGWNPPKRRDLELSGDHDHDHGAHAPIGSDEVSEFEILELAVRELSIEKGLFSQEDHRRFAEWADNVGPHGGSKLVAKAWTDPEFKARLLADGTEACKEVGIDWRDPTGEGTPSDYTYFYVLENTPKVHNVIVCTLCSCYPRPVLGMSPDWYRTPNYRRRLVRWPREVLAEFGLHFPADVEVRVHDSNQKSRFMVMPMRPEGTEGWSEEQLAQIITRDTMIGVALPQVDWTASDPPSKVGA